MSASDLVPRVVLFVTDLKRENAELKSQVKEQEDERLLVQITGPNRTPIYYEGSLKDGYSLPFGTALLGFHFERLNESNIDVVLPLSFFTSLELWMSGTFVEHFQNTVRLNDTFFLFDDDDVSGSGTGRGNISFTPGGGVHHITATIGPMTYTDYFKLTDAHLELEEQIAVDDNVSFMIKSIYILKDKIPVVMSLLERLGIPTLDNNYDSEGDVRATMMI